MTSRSLYSGLSIIFGLMVSFSCARIKPWATAPMAPASLDLKAKNLSPGLNKSIIYIYAPVNTNRTIRAQVIIDGHEAGVLIFATYFCFELALGEHEIILKTENWDYNSISKKYEYISKQKDDFEFKTPPPGGRAEYIRIVQSAGLLGYKCKLKLMDEVSGKKDLEKCNLLHAEHSDFVPCELLQ